MFTVTFYVKNANVAVIYIFLKFKHLEREMKN